MEKSLISTSRSFLASHPLRPSLPRYVRRGGVVLPLQHRRRVRTMSFLQEIPPLLGDSSSVDLHSIASRVEGMMYTLADAAVVAVDPSSGGDAVTEAATTTVQKSGGWFGFISEAMEVVLKVLKDGLSAVHVPYAYGFAIILLTVIVKVVTLPLTKSQVESTLAMQNIQPKVKAIQKRYAGNQERIQLETSRLYQKAGINPLAGCLPTLATVPVWIGLYQALSNVANEGLLTEGFLWVLFPITAHLMSKPLQRAFSGGNGVLLSDHDNGLASFQTLSTGKGGGSCRSRAAVLFFLKLSLGVIVAFAVSGSLYWTITMSTSPLQLDSFLHGYHQNLEEQVITDLSKIIDLSSVGVQSKVVESCPPEYQDYVPFYQKKVEERKNCLIVPPRNYRIPLRWPTGKDFIWKENVKMSGREFSSGSLTKRMMVEEEQISFHSDSLMVDGVEDYSHQIAETIGLDDSDDWNRGGIRNVLDIGCGFGSLGAHLFSKQLLTTCIADYEESGSQVQITLERGLPAIIASFGSVRLPFPNLSFDMLHCGRCGIDWDAKPAGGTPLLEVDRLLKPGGYFVLTWNTSARLPVEADNLCWRMLSQPTDETIVWKKPTNADCYVSKKSEPKICEREEEKGLQRCIIGNESRRWAPIEDTPPWPSRAKPINSTELNKRYGLRMEDLVEDGVKWGSLVKNYWSLLSPLIFSDHPKRPGDEEPPPPPNMVRNVLDMNAGNGGFNSAMLDAGKDVWVMNVVPPTAPISNNHLPLILDRGFVGVEHHWCHPFPTYPRTYDMVHGDGILTLTDDQTDRCSTMLDLLIEIDRILRPHGWVILRDKADLIEAARYAVSSQLRWEARLIVPDVKTGDGLLVCQKTFIVEE